MLQAAREQQRQDVDIVVGAVETHDRPETQGLLEGLEVIPRRRLEYRGQKFEEMNLDAILARRPALVVVDGLAHSNAPGSRHPKRFQDVEELLDAGIDVYTTLNIEHLESLNHVVAQITGLKAREPIPDRILDRADEIELVDLSPEELLRWLREGKVYVPEQAERAVRKYFLPSGLTASGDLAPRETTEHGDDHQQPALRTQPGDGHRTVAERTTVAVSQEPLAEQPEQRLKSPLAARDTRPKESLRRYFLAAALVAAAGLAATAVMAVLPLRDPGMLFLAAVLLSAVVGGLHASIFASILSVLVYDFFFTEPFHSLRITDPQDYLSLGAFLIVAVLTSHLTARVRDQADAARRREARTAALYAFGRAITGAATIDDLCHAIATHVAQTLDTATAVLLPDAGQLTGRAAHPADVQLDASEWATATWAWEHDQPAGRSTETLPGGEWQ